MEAGVKFLQHQYVKTRGNKRPTVTVLQYPRTVKMAPRLFFRHHPKPAVEGHWPSRAGKTKQKQKRFFGSLRDPKAASFKKSGMKKNNSLSLRTFFFAAIPNFFLIPPRQSNPLGWEGRATQRVDQIKTRRGGGSIMSAAVAELTAEVSKSGNCVREVYLGDAKPVIKHSWRLHTLGVGLTTTLVDSKSHRAKTASGRYTWSSSASTRSTGPARSLRV